MDQFLYSGHHVHKEHQEKHNVAKHQKEVVKPYTAAKKAQILETQYTVKTEREKEVAEKAGSLAVANGRGENLDTKGVGGTADVDGAVGSVVAKVRLRVSLCNGLALLYGAPTEGRHCFLLHIPPPSAPASRTLSKVLFVLPHHLTRSN